MAARKKNRGLVYLRRSSSGQEVSLDYQLDWAIDQARRHDVALDATPIDLNRMQRERVVSYKSLRMDDSVTGADLDRPGFKAVMNDALADPTISHIFIHKRDRLARPEEAIEMVALEKQLLLAGITIVLSDGSSEPCERGEGNIVRDLGLLFAYYESGEFLRKHAERVLEAQKRLALQGFRTGGNAPYGFARVLVAPDGTVLEELPPRRRVRQAGCHVRIVPKDDTKIKVWLLILDLADQGWGPKRIARHLDELGIPGPGAGTIRTDHGVSHKVTGTWWPNTVRELIRNRAILGYQVYGRRSEGAHRRLGSSGPRHLTDTDRSGNGEAKVIFNEPLLRINAKLPLEPLFDPDRWESIQERIDMRGKSQRGVPRVRDLARFPLSCRVIDLTNGCGHPMYAQTSGQRRRYVCGRYTKTNGAQCDHNHVDAEAALRFVVTTIGQLVYRFGDRTRLETLLKERAGQARQADPDRQDPSIAAALRTKLTDLEDQLATVRRRLCTEKDDRLYEALGEEYKALARECEAARRRLQQEDLGRPATAPSDPNRDTTAALALLEDMQRVLTDPGARAKVNGLLDKLGVRLGLLFTGATKGKGRQVRKLTSGVMTFGDAPLPVRLYGADNAEQTDEDVASDGHPAPSNTADRREVINPKTTRSMVDGPKATGPRGVAAARAPDAVGHPVLSRNRRREGVSFTKVIRGDWI